jgi:sugar phosphate isomerase/epimerase
MLRPRGLEHLTLLDVAPPEFVQLTAGAGFDAVGLRIAPVTDAERPWPMAPGSPMLAETVRRCRGEGIEVLDVEAIRLGPEPDDCEPVLAAAAELGARHVNVICEDPDPARLRDHFGSVAALAAPYRIRPVVEIMAYRVVKTLADALSVIEGTPGGLLIDALHVQRCGVDLAELARVDPAGIAYLQLCDAPLKSPAGHPETEARTARLLPGMGELPLAGLLAALPDGIPVAVEAPGLDRTSNADFAARARAALDNVLQKARDQ